MTSTAGSLTPETIDLGDLELQDSDGQESRRSRSFRGSVFLETPRYAKRKIVIVPAPVAPPKSEKVLYVLNPYRACQFVVSATFYLISCRVESSMMSRLGAAL